MRILEIRGPGRIIIQVDATELDTIVNDFLDQQHMIGYDEGYNDWARACENANVDDDNPKEE